MTQSIRNKNKCRDRRCFSAFDDAHAGHHRSADQGSNPTLMPYRRTSVPNMKITSKHHTKTTLQNKHHIEPTTYCLKGLYTSTPWATLWYIRIGNICAVIGCMGTKRHQKKAFCTVTGMGDVLLVTNWINLTMKKTRSRRGVGTTLPNPVEGSAWMDEVLMLPSGIVR